MASIERKWITNTATSPIYAHRPKGCPVFNSLWNFEYENSLLHQNSFNINN